jgi:hypothetical protein
MFDKVVLDNLKPFFQFAYQTHINLYLTKIAALPYYRDLAFLTPS